MRFCKFKGERCGRAFAALAWRERPEWSLVKFPSIDQSSVPAIGDVTQAAGFVDVMLINT